LFFSLLFGDAKIRILLEWRGGYEAVGLYSKSLEFGQKYYEMGKNTFVLAHFKKYVENG